MAPRENARTRGGDAPKNDYPQIKIITPPIRMSYPHIFDPIENDQGKDVWEIDGLIPPDLKYPKNHPDHGGKFFDDVLMDALNEVMEKHFGPEDKWPTGRNDYAPQDKIRNCNPDKLPGPGITEDWKQFKARSYSPVGIVDADKNEVLNKREAYGGRWCRLSLTVTVYDQSKSKGPAIYLNNVQLLDNDESFGGRPSASSEFDTYDGPEQAPRGDRSRDRDRDQDDDRGRGGGRGSRDDDRSRDSGRSRSDRDGRGSGRDREDDRGDSRGRNERDSGRSGRDDDRGGRDREPDRGRGRESDRGSSSRGRDGAEEADDRGSRRGSRDRDEGDRRSSREEKESEGRGGRDRDERGGRDRGDDRDRDDRGRGRGRDDDREERSGRGSRDDEDDRRPSDRGGSRSSRDDDDWH
jgi:hypothetical protein